MDADDFQDLYKLLRGSRSALAVLDARALYMEQKMADAYDKLSYARATFVESRSRLLKQDVEKQVDAKTKDAEKQIKKLKRKQDKLLDTLKGFDELLPPLEKLANREKAKQAKAESESSDRILQRADELPPSPPAANDNIARPIDVSKDFMDAYCSAAGDEQLDVINGRFGFREVQSESEIHGDALYFIRTSQQSLLVCTPASDEMTETIVLASAVDDRPIKPCSREAFMKLGTRRKMVLLTKKEISDQTDFDTGVEEQESLETVAAGEQHILDDGAFGQLLTAAQRSGLVSNADQIGHIRDREFRMGKYDKAFQGIDAIFSRFTASASKRAQQLRREDAEIASGAIKISPKQLKAKRARDRVQTQEIDRAMRRFQVVVEGLRILMKTA